MAVAAPPRLSELADLLLRRPAVTAGAGHLGRPCRRPRLVRGAGAPPPSPRGGGGAGGPRRTTEGGGFRPSLRGAALPPLRTVLRVLPDRGGGARLYGPPQGHPLRPAGRRLRGPARDVGRIPRGALGPGTAGKAPRFLLYGTRRDTGGMAGVGGHPHPARHPAPNSRRRHTPGDSRQGGEGHQVRGSSPGRLLGLGRDRQLLLGQLL